MAHYMGFVGGGKVASQTFVALMDDFIEANTDPVFVLPVSKTTWTPQLQLVVGYAKEHDIAYVTFGANVRQASLKQVTADADDAQVVTDPVVGMLDYLAKQMAEVDDESVVVLFWDEADDLFKVFELASDRNIPCLDATSGLDVLYLDDVEGEEPTVTAVDPSLPTEAAEEEVDDEEVEEPVAAPIPAAIPAPVEDVEDAPVPQTRRLAVVKHEVDSALQPSVEEVFGMVINVLADRIADVVVERLNED